jgi:hypothetical protein
MAQPRRLFREMAGNLSIKPVLNLGSQMKDFDGHNGIPLQFRGPQKPTVRAQVKPKSTYPDLGPAVYVAYPADRFQYLSVNIS